MNCPQCRNAMIPGTLHVDAGSIVGTTLSWISLDEPLRQGQLEDETMERIKYARYDVDLPGFRCLQCKLLVVRHEDNHPTTDGR
ncbi:MAG: hypothetical protein JSV76_07450 [Candidatus Bathyarchaeota archaeon]|nr:MAG: hypothetical protein JSV76_07450 [Candidatus Bathyarchaeota archaeon]